MGAYRLSAGFVNLDPARMIRQCPFPHVGDHAFVLGSLGQSQYFWVSVKPIPVFDQSVDKQVKQSFSNAADSVFDFLNNDFL